MDNKYVTFIPDHSFVNAARKVIDAIKRAETDRDFFRNTIDPFSAIFDTAFHDISLSNWFESEKGRQVQKSLQNAIGTFHQDILEAMPGWESMSEVLDIKNTDKKIIAEIKNKYNTTKGNHRTAIYDDVKSLLSRPEYAEYKGYYVEVLPENRRIYDKPFTPSDNTTSTRRPKNPNIRIIDGKSFYALASGHAGALKDLYKALPNVLADVMGADAQGTINDPMFNLLIDKAIA